MDDQQFARLSAAAVAAARGGVEAAVKNLKSGEPDLVAFYVSAMGMIAAAAATVHEVEELAALVPGAGKSTQQRRTAFVRMCGEVWDDITASAMERTGRGR